MSILKAILHQLGLSVAPANNFTLDASADNGTMKLARGNAGATTQDVMVVAADGGVSIRGGVVAPAPGFVGELINFVLGGTINLTGSGIPTALGGFTLPAGVWDLSIYAQFKASIADDCVMQWAAFGSTPTGSNLAVHYNQARLARVDQYADVQTGAFRRVVTVPTLMYVSGGAIYTIGTATAAASVAARRVA